MLKQGVCVFLSHFHRRVKWVGLLGSAVVVGERAPAPVSVMTWPLPGLPQPPHILPPPCWPFLSSAASPAQSESKEGCGGGAELVSCPGSPQARGRMVTLPTGCLPCPELGAFTLPELIF